MIRAVKEMGDGDGSEREREFMRRSLENTHNTSPTRHAGKPGCRRRHHEMEKKIALMKRTGEGGSSSKQHDIPSG